METITNGYIKYATKDILNRYNNLLASCFNKDGSFDAAAYERKNAHMEYHAMIEELVVLLEQAGTNIYQVSLVRGTVGYLRDSFTTVVDSQLAVLNNK